MTRKNLFAILATVIATMLTGCQQDISTKSGDGYKSVDPATYFDFSTVFNCPVSIQSDHKTLVNIYSVDPAQNPEVEPIYAAFTDYSGSYRGTMEIPTAYIGKTLWAKGTSFQDKAVVGKNGVSFSSNFIGSRAAAVNTDMYTDEEIKAECKRLYDLYIKRLPERENNTSKLSETENLAIYTTKDNTELMFSFVNSGGRYVSQLYYFYFPQDVDATEYMRAYCSENNTDGFNSKAPEEQSMIMRKTFMRLFTQDTNDETKKKFLLTHDWGVFYTHTKQYSHSGGKSGGDMYVVHDADGNLLTGNGFLDAKTSYSGDELKAAKAQNRIQQHEVNGTMTNFTWSHWNYQGYGFVNRNFNNQIGARHHLRFYGENYDKYLTDDDACYLFPAGYRIGFILKVKNYDKRNEPTEQQLNMFTTNNALNKNGNIQCARNLSISQASDNRQITNVIYGFEDKILDEGSDKDYNDFMFMISASPEISTVGMEEFSETGTMMREGTLLYEDLYPAPGDYDMNDVMVEYEMKVKFNENNYVEAIDCKFWPTCYGATYDDDFYIELTTDDNKGHFKQWIKPTLIASASQLRSMSNTNYANIQGGMRPTRCIERSYTFKASQKLHKDSIKIENFNPFIYVHNTNREVHLTNNVFRGVNGASNAGLTEGQMKYYPLMIDDPTSPLDGCYFPYAMNVPRRFTGLTFEGFTPVTESVYIILEYTRFLKWMQDPTTNTDWYNDYKKWQ